MGLDFSDTDMDGRAESPPGREARTESQFETEARTELSREARTELSKAVWEASRRRQPRRMHLFNALRNKLPGIEKSNVIITNDTNVITVFTIIVIDDDSSSSVVNIIVVFTCCCSSE